MTGLFTTGEVARQLRMTVRQVQFRVRKADIQPAGRAGTLFLFNAEQIQQIAMVEASNKGGRPRKRTASK